MSIYNVGNLRKVSTTTPTSNNPVNKLKFGQNEDSISSISPSNSQANKPIKVSSSISEKIKKLSSSTSSNEILDTPALIPASTAVTNSKVLNSTNGKDKKPTSTASGASPLTKTNGTTTTKPVNSINEKSKTLSGNISTYITSEVSAVATIKSVNAPKESAESSSSSVKTANEIPVLAIKDKCAESINNEIELEVEEANSEVTLAHISAANKLANNKEIDGKNIEIIFFYFFLKWNHNPTELRNKLIWQVVIEGLCAGIIILFKYTFFFYLKYVIIKKKKPVIIIISLYICMPVYIFNFACKFINL